MKSIIICARAWSSPNCGTSRHSAYIFLNGERVGYYNGGQYSDHGSIEETVMEWLEERNLIERRQNGMPRESTYDYCQRTRTNIETVITWVERKKDL